MERRYTLCWSRLSLSNACTSGINPAASHHWFELIFCESSTVNLQIFFLTVISSSLSKLRLHSPLNFRLNIISRKYSTIAFKKYAFCLFVQVVLQKGIFINNIYLNIKIKSVNVFYSFYLPVHAINYSDSISAFEYQKDTGRSETYPTILSKKHLNFGTELPKISHPVSLLNIYSCCYNISLKKYIFFCQVTATEKKVPLHYFYTGNQPNTKLT